MKMLIQCDKCGKTTKASLQGFVIDDPTWVAVTIGRNSPNGNVETSVVLCADHATQLLAAIDRMKAAP